MVTCKQLLQFFPIISPTEAVQEEIDAIITTEKGLSDDQLVVKGWHSTFLCLHGLHFVDHVTTPYDEVREVQADETRGYSQQDQRKFPFNGRRFRVAASSQMKMSGLQESS